MTLTHSMRRGALFLSGAWLAWPESMQACLACTRQTDSKMADGMNAGILAMLLILLPVLVAFALFFVNLGRKSASTTAAKAAHKRA